MEFFLRSLTGRVLLASLFALPLFLGISGLYLERSHRLSIEAAEGERLQLQIFTLLAQAEYNALDDSLSLPGELIETRLAQPSSGLYAQILNARGEALWQSPSMRQSPSIQTPVNQQQQTGTPPLATGEHHFLREQEHFRLVYQVLWESSDSRDIPLRFEVLETTTAVDADLRSYRRHLFFWLGGAALMLLLYQLAVLIWGLQPLRSLARDIGAVEAGDSDRLSGNYPREVQALTDNLNTLLHAEQQRRERARSTLADLAHSLKTPLAVIGSANPSASSYHNLLREQLQQMEEIIAYQLQRAVGGSHQLLRMIEVAPLIERLQTSLHKVYADKPVQIRSDVTTHSSFRGDPRDLMEVLGNLLDNACKYGAGKVLIKARTQINQLQIAVHDNGPGITPDLRQHILQRGVRADSRNSGQGIGLAVALDIISSYGGHLEIDDSPLGGACVRFFISG
ncbi:MAG: ATP-binding protein [Parahaliea sp.]